MTGSTGQRMQQIELLGGQFFFHDALVDRASRRVDPQGAVLHDRGSYRRFDRLRRFGCRRAASQDGADPGDDLLRVKWLFHIIVRPAVEPEQLVVDFRAGREQQNRRGCQLANLAAGFHAIKNRHHDVQHDQVRLAVLQRKQRFQAVFGFADLKAGLFQIDF